MLPASKGELEEPSGRFPQDQASPSVSPAAAAERERQAEVGSEEGACARILQQPSKDKAESESVRGEGDCGGLHRAEAAWCHLRDTRKLALNSLEAREAEEGDNSAAPRCSQPGWCLPACKGCSSGSWVSAAHLNQTCSQVKSGSLENCDSSPNRAMR